MDLCQLDAIAGNEYEVRDYLLAHTNKEKFRVIEDGLGSLIFNKVGKGPKVLFMAHMDEVGFIVKSIRENGRLILHNVGGVDLSLSNLHKVNVTTESGEKIPGVLHTKDKLESSIAEVDIATSALAESVALSIQVGDMVCFAGEPFKSKNNRVFAKALDDRVGCYVLLKAMEEIENQELEIDLYFAFTSSEEVGIRGGKTSTSLVQPDYSFAVDVASTKNSIPQSLNTRKIGDGFMIVHYDKTLAPSIQFIRKLRKIADANDLSHQNDIFAGGGTDAGSSHLVGSGRTSAVLGIPLRECHGPYSLCDMKDIESLIKMTQCILKNLKN